MQAYASVKRLVFNRQNLNSRNVIQHRLYIQISTMYLLQQTFVQSLRMTTSSCKQWTSLTELGTRLNNCTQTWVAKPETMIDGTLSMLLVWCQTFTAARPTGIWYQTELLGDRHIACEQLAPGDNDWWDTEYATSVMPDLHCCSANWYLVSNWTAWWVVTDTMRVNNLPVA